MFLVGFILTIYALVVLFDIIANLLLAHKVVDAEKNENFKKAMEFTGKLTKPVYGKVSEFIPEEYRVISGIETVPLLIFIVLSVLGQLMM